MKIISILNQKGGCGKTTTAVNLSSALAREGYKTLLIDFDPQAHTTFSLGMNNSKGICELIEDYLNTGSSSLDSHITPRTENLFVVTSSLGLSAIEHKLNSREDKLYILYKILGPAASLYDYCIIDCPPNLGVLSLNATFAGNYILTPFLACDLSLQGINVLNQIIEMMAEAHPTTLSFFYLLTQYDRRFRYSLEFLERARSMLKNKLLPIIIRTNINLRESQSLGKTIFEHKPYSRGSYDYTKLAEKIIDITQQIKWTRLFLKNKKFKEVHVVGDFNQWQKNEKYKMKKIDAETWTISIPLKKGKYHYKFFADEFWLTDPLNSFEENDSFGGKNSVISIR